MRSSSYARRSRSLRQGWPKRFGHGSHGWNGTNQGARRRVNARARTNSFCGTAARHGSYLLLERQCQRKHRPGSSRDVSRRSIDSIRQLHVIRVQIVGADWRAERPHQETPAGVDHGPIRSRLIRVKAHQPAWHSRRVGCVRIAIPCGKPRLFEPHDARVEGKRHDRRVDPELS